MLRTNRQTNRQIMGYTDPNILPAPTITVGVGKTNLYKQVHQAFDITHGRFVVLTTGWSTPGSSPMPSLNKMFSFSLCSSNDFRLMSSKSNSVGFGSPRTSLASSSFSIRSVADVRRWSQTNNHNEYCKTLNFCGSIYDIILVG